MARWHTADALSPSVKEWNWFAALIWDYNRYVDVECWNNEGNRIRGFTPGLLVLLRIFCRRWRGDTSMKSACILVIWWRNSCHGLHFANVLIWCPLRRWNSVDFIRPCGALRIFEQKTPFLLSFPKNLETRDVGSIPDSFSGCPNSLMRYRV